MFLKKMSSIRDIEGVRIIIKKEIKFKAMSFLVIACVT